MLPKVKINLIIIFALVIGLVIGFVVCLCYFGKTIGSSMQMLNSMHVADWGERAHNAYLNNSPEVAIWALSNLAQISEERSELFPIEKVAKIDLVLTYARLAKVYKEQGNIEKYNDNMTKALALSPQAFRGKVNTEEELLSVVQKIDALGSKHTE